MTILGYASTSPSPRTLRRAWIRSDSFECPYEPRYSILSFAFAAAVVCHCMLPGASAPPRFSGLM